MIERLLQWWYWFTMPWTFRHLPQCYRNAITGLACCFDGEPPPPKGKVWACELWIDPEYMGLGVARLEDAESGKPAPEYEWVVGDVTTTAGSVYTAVTMTARPRRLGGFQGPETAP